MNDNDHLLAIVRLCEEVRASVERYRPTAEDPTWPDYLDTVATIAAIWHHLEEINTAEEDERDPYF